MSRLRVFVFLLIIAVPIAIGGNLALMNFSGAAPVIDLATANLGWPENDIVVTGGGYSGHPFDKRAWRTFRSKSKEEFGEIRVTVERVGLFGKWKLAEYEHEAL